MKVIIIKKCKEGNINDVIDVSTGYATNFLIKQGYALPFNVKTSLMLEKKLQKLEMKHDLKKQNAIKAKEIIELLTLKFALKTTNMVVHGSITKKQILKELLNNKIKIDTHNIDNIKISSLGITNVNIKLYKGINAVLKIEVSSAKK